MNALKAGLFRTWLNAMPDEDARGAHDPETLARLRAVLDDAWNSLTPEQQARTAKSEMALRILRLAQLGVRDVVRLRRAAVIETVGSEKRPAAPSARRGEDNLRFGDSGGE